MGKVLLVLVAALALAVLGGGVYLAFFDIPVPTTRVEKVLPDAQFQK